MSNDTASLAKRSSKSAARAILGQGAALFVAAGTWSYVQAWLYLGITLSSTLLTNLYLMRHDPALLERRLALEEQGEREPVQRRCVVLMVVFGLMLLVVAGLDVRYRWSSPSLLVQAFGFVAFILSVGGVFATFRANSFASSVIEVEAQQQVVSSGPYGWVRHPMYTAVLLGTAATPLCLGSYVAEVLLLPMVVVFVVRLLAEERLLLAQLPGYDAYVQQVRSRLFPGLW